MRVRSLVCGVLAASLVVACGDDDLTGPETAMYLATLSGANERPTAVTSSGTGSFHGVVSEGGVLNYTISWSGLGSNSNNAHIHGPITSGSTAAAGVLIDLNAPAEGRTVTHGTNGSGSASGTINLRVALNANVSADSLRKLFDNQALYVNVHTVNNPGGEIAGVITRAAN